MTFFAISNTTDLQFTVTYPTVSTGGTNLSPITTWTCVCNDGKGNLFSCANAQAGNYYYVKGATDPSPCQVNNNPMIVGVLDDTVVGDSITLTSFDPSGNILLQYSFNTKYGTFTFPSGSQVNNYNFALTTITSPYNQNVTGFLATITANAPNPSTACPAITLTNGNGGNVYLNLTGGNNPIYPNANIDQIGIMLQNGGITKASLAFAQIGDVSNIWSGSGPFSPNDGLSTVLQDAGSSYIQKLIATLKTYGVSTGLSFGKSAISALDLTIGSTSAQNLVSLVNLLGLDFVDFDIEINDTCVVNVGDSIPNVGPCVNPSQYYSSASKGCRCNFLFSQNTTAEISSFFSYIKSKVTTTLTVNGFLPYSGGYKATWGWVPGCLSSLFLEDPTNSASENIFSSMFDHLNIMTYGAITSPVTINSTVANYPSEAIENFIFLAGGDASKVSIGFYDQIDYTTVAYDAGKPTIPSGLSSPQAAAWVYQSTLKSIGYTPSQLGEPFFWTDTPATLGGTDFFPCAFNTYLQNNPI